MSQKTTQREVSPSERKRLHVAAMVTQEKEWPQSEPNQGLARMFVIMLLVHVIVIGGVIVYDFVAEPADAKISGGPTASKKTTAPLPVVTEISPAARVTSAPAPASVASVAPAAAQAPVRAPSPALAPSSPPALTAKPVESLLPAGYSTIPDGEKEVHTASAMLTAPLPPAPAPAAAKTNAIIVHSDPPAPTRPTIITETTEKPTAPPPTRVKTPERDSVVKRAVMVSPPSPKPVATPTQARRELNNDSAVPTKKKSVESSLPAPAKKSPTKPAASGSRYTVAKGDTVYAIARRYKISEDALMRANGIKKAAGLQIGKSLTIPAK
jgi:LysM repeat protein